MERTRCQKRFDIVCIMLEATARLKKEIVSLQAIGRFAATAVSVLRTYEPRWATISEVSSLSTAILRILGSVGSL